MKWLEDILTVGGTLVLILLIFVGAYYAAKLIGKKYTLRRESAGSGKIRLVDQLSMGPDRLLAIVETGGKTLLLGVTPHHVELLQELDPDKFPPEKEEEKKDTPAFSSLLQDALKTWKGKPFGKSGPGGGDKL